jgi:nephrocystin-3
MDEKKPERFELAATLNNLGNLDGDQGRMEEARKDFAEALQTYRELAQKNPDTYRPYVATTLSNLGILDRKQGQMEEARKEFCGGAADSP